MGRELQVWANQPEDKTVEAESSESLKDQMQSTGTGEDGHGLGYRWDVWLSSCLSHPSPPVSPTTVGYLTTPPTALASTPTTMLSQPGALVRMQGVPYTAGMKDLLSVFQAYQVRLYYREGSGGLTEPGAPTPKCV